MSYKIQHLGLGGILDQAIAICKDHFGLLFTIMLLLLIPFSLFVNLVTKSMMPDFPAWTSFEDFMRFNEIQQEVHAKHWVFFWGTWLLQMLVILPITNAAVIQAVARLYLGETVTAVEALKHGLSRLGPLIVTSILMYLAVMGGMILCIVPGILFALWFGLSQHVVVLEGISGPRALGRSKMLVRANLGTFFVLGLILTVIAISLNMGANFIPQPHLRSIIATLLQAATMILSTAAGVVFYFSCRCAAENFDLHYLAQAIGAEPATANERGGTLHDSP